MIHLHNINKSYHLGSGDSASTMHVLKDVSMTVETGEMVSIMGSSGSGKSTLLNILGLLDAFDSGEYTLAGENMVNLSATHAAGLRNRHIGFVFQFHHLLPDQDAVHNVMIPALISGMRQPEARDRASALLERVGAPTDLSTLILIQGDRHYLYSTAALRTLAVMNESPQRFNLHKALPQEDCPRVEGFAHGTALR